MEQNLAGLAFSSWAPRTKKYEVWGPEGAFWALVSLLSAVPSSCLWVTSDGSLMFQQEGAVSLSGRHFRKPPGSIS